MTWPTDIWHWDHRRQAFILRKPAGEARVWVDKVTGTWWSGQVTYKSGDTAWLSTRRNLDHVQAEAEALLNKVTAA